jgi:cysteine-rich repeat protein
VYAGEEECDDSNVENCDGCTAYCTEELDPVNGILLMRDDDVFPTGVTDAVDSIGFAYNNVHNDTRQYSSDAGLMLPYTMIVYYQFNRAISAEEQEALDRYVQCGGRLLLTGYDSMASPLDIRLAEVARVTTAGDGPFEGNCTVTYGSTPATDGPHGYYPEGTDFSVSQTDHDNVEADATAGSIELIGVSDAAKLTYAEDVGTGGGNVFYWNGNALLEDWSSAGTTQDIFLNILEWQFGDRDIYGAIALPYDFYDFDMDAAHLLERAVTYGIAGNPVVGAVSECVDSTDSTHSGSPGGPYAGEFHATIAALELAGHPAGDIITLADAAEAASRAGEYDVLLFMEQEECNPDPAPWIPVVRDLLDAGGRVVFTSPFQSTSFVNGLGMFGSGSRTGITAPYSTAEDPFWEGIVHPGQLNATDGWEWSGPGLVPLAWDEDYASRLSVWGYLTIGGVFAGYATWNQDGLADDDATQDLLMEQACEDAYPGSRPASIEEIATPGIIDGLPATNTSGRYLLGVCPYCQGVYFEDCVDDHTRNCVAPNNAWPTSYDPWPDEDFCYRSTRTCICLQY